jgi:hypothetical protein
MFDPPIQDPQSILVRRILRAARCALDDMPEGTIVQQHSMCGVDPTEGIHFDYTRR